MNYTDLMKMISGYKTTRFGKWPHIYGGFVRSRSSKGLFDFIDRDGFFKFHISNKSKQIVSIHQIVAFYCCGGRQALENGEVCVKDEVEINHHDGNTFNNHPTNLEYVPSEIHAIKTKHQRVLHKHLRLFKKGAIGIYRIWNRKGKLVSKGRFWDWFKNSLIKTMVATARFRGVKLLPAQFGQWLKRICKRLGMGVDSTFVTTFIINWRYE